MRGKADSPQSGIIRVVKDRKHPYKVINTSFADDERLSWEARGVLVYLLSKPDDWEMQIPDLVRRGNIGRDAMYRVIKELAAAGYVRRIRERAAGGTFQWYTLIYESPLPENQEVAPLPDSPDLAEPDLAEPDLATQEVALIKVPIKKGLNIKGLNTPSTKQQKEQAESFDAEVASVLAQLGFKETDP